MMGTLSGPGTTRYSAQIDGNKGNYGTAVRFDLTDGYLGIDGYKGHGVTERILLSPTQVKKLLAFVKPDPARRVKE
jgi:hypothetical protein